MKKIIFFLSCLWVISGCSDSASFLAMRSAQGQGLTLAKFEIGWQPVSRGLIYPDIEAGMCYFLNVDGSLVDSDYTCYNQIISPGDHIDDFNVEFTGYSVESTLSPLGGHMYVAKIYSSSEIVYCVKRSPSGCTYSHCGERSDCSNVYITHFKNLDAVKSFQFVLTERCEVKVSATILTQNDLFPARINEISCL